MVGDGEKIFSLMHQNNLFNLDLKLKFCEIRVLVDFSSKQDLNHKGTFSIAACTQPHELIFC